VLFRSPQNPKTPFLTKEMSKYILIKNALISEYAINML